MLDGSATTPLRPEAAAAMGRVIREVWGNPSSLHAAGLAAEREVAAARASVLAALCGMPGGSAASVGTPSLPGAPSNAGTLIFTSGGTEANNLAILGVARAKKRGVRRFITTAGEHPSVEGAMKRLGDEGMDVVRLSTNGGVIDLDELKTALTPETAMVSIMLVNNETGALYPVAEAFAAVKRYGEGIVTHCDAVQAFGKLPFTPRSLGADLVTVSAHKIGGPKGVGALFVSQGVLKGKRLVPITYGGGQEGGLRPGTENTVGIAGFGAAAAAFAASPSGQAGEALPAASLEEALGCGKNAAVSGFGKPAAAYGLNAAHAAAPAMTAALLGAAAARDYILARLPGGVVRNNPHGASSPDIVSLLLPGIKSETMLNFLSARGIYVSAGSACSSRSGKPSPALTAFGLDAARAASTLRVSFGGDICGGSASYRRLDVFLAALAEGCETLARATLTGAK